MAFLEPSPVDMVISETTIPRATDSLPMKIIMRERLFLLSLENAIFFRKINRKLQNNEFKSQK